MTVVFEYPGLPLSENRAYFTKGKMRILNKDGRAWKSRLRSDLWEALDKELNELLDLAGDDLWIMVGYDIYFDSLVNKGWLKGKAKTRYKKCDARTRVKLLEDALSEALGIDDSRFQVDHIYKWHDPDNPRVRVELTVIDPEDFGVPEGFIDVEGGGAVPSAR